MFSVKLLIFADRLSHDGVHNLFLSLLGAELVLPRTVSFSDKIDLVPILISKLVVNNGEVSFPFCFMFVLDYFRC